MSFTTLQAVALSVRADGVICVNPVRTLFDGVTANFFYKGAKITLCMKNDQLTVTKKGGGKVVICTPDGKEEAVKGSLIYRI